MPTTEITVQDWDAYVAGEDIPALPAHRRVLRPSEALFSHFNVLMDGVRLGAVDEKNLPGCWTAFHRTGHKSFHDTREEAAIAICERAGWGSHAPAQSGDFRFEIIEHEEPEMGCTHTVVMIDDKGFEIERFTTDNPYGAVEAARERQAHPDLEERWAREAEREARERGGW